MGRVDIWENAVLLWDTSGGLKMESSIWYIVVGFVFLVLGMVICWYLIVR